MSFSSNLEGSRDIVALINETASALGANPVDLATIISYETGGTFDPMQTGPLTQWGQHRGLIQFGEPQAKQHGADFSSSDAALTSQLGASGAIVNYFRQNGWQDGMGILDMYSIINAGAPRLYDRTDAHSGGMPGTVQEKVTYQMGGHRAKALALLGNEHPEPDAMKSAINAAVAEAVDYDPDAPNIQASNEMNARNDDSASAPLGGASAGKNIDPKIQERANDAQRREIYRAAQEFILSMTPQQRMMEKQLYYKAQLEQGEARGFDQWFTNTRFANYAQEYMNGDEGFVNNLSRPQQVLLQQTTSNVPQAQSFAHYLMGI
jgi:hypothetical protein